MISGKEVFSPLEKELFGSFDKIADFSRFFKIRLFVFGVLVGHKSHSGIHVNHLFVIGSHFRAAFSDHDDIGQIVAIQILKSRRLDPAAGCQAVKLTGKKKTSSPLR